MFEKEKMMQKAYNDSRAVQVAAVFTKLEGGKIDKYKLCKLMYYIERQSILTTGQPLFHSGLFSIKLGPIASEVNDRINAVVPSEKFRFLYNEDEYSRWVNHFKSANSKELRLTSDPGDDELSESNIDLITEISVKFRNYSYSQLVEFFHHLPEHTITDSRIPIPFEKILEEEGFCEDEIQEIQEEYRYYLNLISA